MDIVEEIRQGLAKPGKTQTELARRLGRHPNVVTYILKGERRVQANEVPIIREYLELGQVCRLVGYVGASDEAYLYSSADDPGETVTAPPGATSKTVGVEIRGSSLGEALNGWVAYYDDRREPMTPDLIGRLCVVELDDDRVLIKIPRQARQKGRYHLFPNAGGSAIPDAKIKWAARVIHLMPKS